MAVLEIGNYKLTTLEFGNFKLDGGAMFGVVPQTLWGRYHPPDESNRIEMALRCLLIEGNGRRILVDAGFGSGRAQRFKEIYAFTGEENYLEKGLASLGLTAGDVTDSFITHLHFDHVGGATTGKGSKPIPAFPNAHYHIQKLQLEHARERNERDRASYFPEDFEPLIESGQAVVHEGSYQLAPDIDCVICNGHTPAMQLPRVKGDGKMAVYAADLIPLSSQFPLPWIMAYDLYPLTTLEEKRVILHQAAAEEWIFVFEHDPLRVTGQVIETEKGFALKPE
jgi:glyoxylase-like metal-dependent hydrolase (beta-lactamase superfamily II)